jgi:phosphatidate cytidylyltransferase
MSLRRRFYTVLVLLIVLFVVVQWAPPQVFFLFLQAVIIVVLLEFYNLAQRKRLSPRRTVGCLLGLIIGTPFFFRGIPLELALFLGLLAVGIYFLVATNTVEKVMVFSPSFAITLTGPLYIAFTLDFFYPLRVERGPFYIYFLFAVVFLGDSGAYLFGKLWGRRKMAPWASPNKTWEGSVGGILFAVLGAVAARELLIQEVGLAQAAVCGAFVHAVAQVSDPLESLFKRAVGVKDSSNLLPGHGGFLDRVDSLLLAAPFYYFFVRYFWK